LVTGVWLAAQAGECRAGICKSVHADSEPCDGIASRDSNQTENQNDDDAIDFEVLKEAKIKNDCSDDEKFQKHQEFSLRLEVGLTRLVNELGDFPHRGVNRQILKCSVNN